MTTLLREIFWKVFVLSASEVGGRAEEGGIGQLGCERVVVTGS